ncbi:TonB-dependent receptor [Sulfurimonas sp. HSL-1716]|uniref:TonB-dependent receptor n=1 Tax=Hydrocurvibacter sulfurireducens TaxID=3131937 RepID=UPI0031F77FFF
MKLNRFILLSFACAAALMAEDIKLEAINVDSTTLSDVSHEQIKSADLADALQKAIPSISVNRRSGIANDIILRGMRKDDINVLVDGTKTYGACPNRMDPPVSHVLANNIDSISIIEGPYDVENFGTLSGAVSMKSKKPQKDLHGELDLGFGSFNYKKIGATVSGGNDLIRLMLSGSAETSDQYKDGNGDDFNDQMIKNNVPAGNKYQTQYNDLQAYEKKTIMAKAFVTPTENQELRLSYTANRSDDILYPSTPMDALYDNSNIYDVTYEIKKLGDFSKKLELQYYATDVDHPMSTLYRVAATNIANEVTSHLTTNTQGAKIKNTLDAGAYELLIGLDGSKRNWNGRYYKNGVYLNRDSIPDAYTNNAAIFSELSRSFDAFSFKMGIRYDSTDIKSNAYDTRNYDALSLNILTNYKLNANNKLIFGIGKSSRVPDAKELYFKSSAGTVLGNQNLDQVKNYEADLGLESNYDSFILKTKAFYSKLKDYIIYNNQSSTATKYENIDASIYGISMNGSYFISDALTLDGGVNYQVGRKDTLATNQTDRDLPNITPLKGNLALTYEYKKDSYVKAETIATDAWSRYDSDDKEQAIDGWSVLNMKVSHSFNKHVKLDLGVDNVFDTTYAISNTYADLTLLSGGGSVMLLNEPGRYFYTNLTLKY